MHQRTPPPPDDGQSEPLKAASPPAGGGGGGRSGSVPPGRPHSRPSTRPAFQPSPTPPAARVTGNPFQSTPPPPPTNPLGGNSPWSAAAMQPPAVTPSRPPAALPIAEPLQLTPTPAPVRVTAFSLGSVIELIWADSAAARGIETSSTLSAIATRDVPGASAPLVAPRESTDAARTANDSAVATIRKVLALGMPASMEELGQLFRAGVDAYGSLTAGLALVGGTLHLHFDEVETLRATVTAVLPYASQDQRLSAAVTMAEDLLRGSASGGASLAAEGFSTRIMEAFHAMGRVVPPGYLESHVERALTVGRCFQKRTLLGGEFFRAELEPSGGGSELVVYLPVQVERRLPLYPSFEVKLLADVVPRQDRFESGARALVVHAIARVLGPAEAL